MRREVKFSILDKARGGRKCWKDREEEEEVVLFVFEMKELPTIYIYMVCFYWDWRWTRNPDRQLIIKFRGWI